MLINHYNMGLKYYLKRSKHYIKQIMPFRMVLKYEEKHDFATDYFAWKAKNPQVDFDEKSKWENIVSVTGFGYSGSGAVVDLLREYDDCLVHGMAEGGSKAVIADDDLGEITFITAPGGLIDIDGVVDTPVHCLSDEALNRFAKMIYKNPIYHRDPSYRTYLYKFFDCLIMDYYKMKGTLSPIFAPRLNSYRFSMYPYTKKEYYALCNKLLYSIFNKLQDGKHRLLVLDQLMQGLTYEDDYCKKFMPNFKRILIYRDPRDIYTLIKRLDIQWFPHDSVENFIRSMQRRYSHLDVESKSPLVIRFEDLILDYDSTVAKIEVYLNLGEHKRPQSCLDTSISCKNIGLWKTATDIPQSDYEKIAASMPQYCYTK